MVLFKNKKYIYNLAFIFFIIVGCSVQKNRKPPKIKKAVVEGVHLSPTEADTIYFWKVNNLPPGNPEDIFSYDISKLKPLNKVLEEFEIKNGMMYENDKLLGNVDILLQYNKTQRWLIKIEGGMVTASYQQENFKDWEYQFFSIDGNLAL